MTSRDGGQRRGRAWELLDDALEAGPDPLAFRAVAAALLRFTPDQLEAALAHARVQLESWSDADRMAPWSWACALPTEEPEPGIRLAREIHLDAPHEGYNTIALGAIPESALSGIRALHSCGLYGNEEDQPSALQALVASPASYPHLRRIDELYGEELGAPLSTCCWFQDATACAVDDERMLFGDVRGGAAPALRSLSVRSDDLEKTLRYLSQHKVPSLRELHQVFYSNYPKVPESTVDLSDIELLEQLETLELGPLPVRTVRAVFQSKGLRLRSLLLRGHGTPRHASVSAEEVQLNEADVRLLQRSGTFETVERLELCNELLGDSVVDLVKATEPGRLRELRLCAVNLTDTGARRLAALPHLKHLRRLKLTANPIGADGYGALVSTLSKTGLRELSLSSKSGWTPQDDDSAPREDGDAFARALARAELPELRALDLTSFPISAFGVSSLSEASGLPALARLDLSHTRLGAEGIAGLVRGKLVRALTSLTLNECGVDDAAAAIISRAKFERLRDLSMDYSTIGPRGAAHLAAAPCLNTLFRLSLRDAFIGDGGMTALAQSRYLTRLVELDIQQGGYDRRQVLDEKTARAVIESETFSCLDSIFGGVVDEYGERFYDLFNEAGMDLLGGPTLLRAPAVMSLIYTS